MMLGHMKYRTQTETQTFPFFLYRWWKLTKKVHLWQKLSAHFKFYSVWQHVIVSDWVFHSYTVTGWGQRFYIPPTIKVYCVLHKISIYVTVFNFTGCHVGPQTYFTTIAKVRSDGNRKYEESKLKQSWNRSTFGHREHCNESNKLAHVWLLP